MWKKTYKKTFTNISKETIWQLWTHVESWPTWHKDLEYCSIKGNFEVGNHFLLKPKIMSAVKIQLIEVTPYKSFTDCTSFFGAKMYDKHELVETEHGLKISNEIWVRGPLSWLWIFLVAKKVATSIPQKIDILVALGKKNHEN